MGGRIIALLQEESDMILSGAVEAEGHPVVGKDAGERLGLGRLGVNVADRLESCLDRGDVVIDFTHHLVSLRHLALAAEKPCAMVIGSTGFTAEGIEQARALATRTPCVLAPNMSVGINVLLKALEMVAPILGDAYDVEILEAHHRFKKDAPSGTALKMAEVLARALGRDLEKVGVYSRQGMVGERKPGEIGIQTLRGGDIVGEHTVFFAAAGERLEFVHRALNRDNFARGAIAAARWAVRQKHGLYDMQDVLGLKKLC